MIMNTTLTPKNPKITFGSDPEFMLRKEDGTLASAIGVIPGSKYERFSLGNGAEAFPDNVLAECNIPPANSAAEAKSNFRMCFSRYAKLTKPFRLTTQASAFYPESECSDPRAKEFGCDPEFDAHELRVVQAPVCTTTFRSGGGHVHIGYAGGADVVEDDPNHPDNYEVAMNRVWVIRMCDLFLGIPSVLLDKDPTSKERRKLYGGAGSHRIRNKYGVEYRALSNFWVSRPSLVELIYELASVAVRVVMIDKIHENIWGSEVSPEEVRSAINSMDVEKAKSFMGVVEKYVGADIMQKIYQEIDKPFHNGLEDWDIQDEINN